MPRYKMMKKDSQTQRVIRWCCKSSEDRTKITWGTKIHLVLMGFMVSLCEWDAIFGSNITHYLITLKSFFVKSTPLTNGSTPVAAIFAVYTGSGFGTLLILCFIKWKFQRKSEDKRWPIKLYVCTLSPHKEMYSFQIRSIWLKIPKFCAFPLPVAGSWIQVRWTFPAIRYYNSTPDCMIDYILGGGGSSQK